MRKVLWVTTLLFLTISMLAWAQQPAYQGQLMGRAGWILLVMAAWWLAGRVLAGK